MDAIIVGILILVVTGVLVAIVRALARRPRSPKPGVDEDDILGADILAKTLRDFTSDADAHDGGAHR